jgi:hypothetical protein
MTRENGKMYVKPLPMAGVAHGDGVDAAVGSRCTRAMHGYL